MIEILSQSIWRDEAFSLLLAAKNIPQIVALSIKDSGPPLYYILLHYWLAIFGNSPEAGRLLSLLFHILSLFFAYFIVKKLTQDRLLSFLTSLLVFLNPFLLQYAFEIRNYSFYSFLVLGSFYFFLARRPFLFSLFMIVSLLNHNYALFFLLAFLAAWTLVELRGRISLKSNFILTLKYFLAPFSVAAVWGPIALSQYQKINEGFWIKKFSWPEIMEILKRLVGGDLDYPQKEAVLALAALVGGLLFLLLLFRRGASHISERIIFASIILLPPALIFLISIFKTPIYHERYLMPVIPLLIIFLLWQASQLANERPRFKPVVIVLFFLYLLACLSASINVITRPTKPPLKAAVAEALQKLGPNEIILLQSNLNFLEVKYYVHRLRPDLPVYTVSPDGRVVFYIGGVLFEKREILTAIPKDKTVWQVQTDGHLQKLSEGSF